MIAVEPDRAICDRFGSLGIWTGDCDAVWSETFLELSIRGVRVGFVIERFLGTYWKSQGEAA